MAEKEGAGAEATHSKEVLSEEIINKAVDIASELKELKDDINAINGHAEKIQSLDVQPLVEENLSALDNVAEKEGSGARTDSQTQHEHVTWNNNPNTSKKKVQSKWMSDKPVQGGKPIGWSLWIAVAIAMSITGNTP